jgi:SAM-dependent methyltransferase
MGMLKQHIKLLAREQARHAIRGRVLVLGQQSIYATLPEVKTILQDNRAPAVALPEGFDTANKIPAWKGTWWDRNTNVTTVLTLMGAKEVVITDISDYEGATLLLDLNNPVPAEHAGQFDVILDIGTLEHLFDVPTALANMAKMLKTGGELIIIVPVSNAIDHGFYMFSPTLMFDYFKANGFDSFDCYLRAGSANFMNPLQREAKVYKYNRVGSEGLLSSYNFAVEMSFFATKRESPAAVQKPIQSRYVTSDYWTKTGVNMVAEGSFIARYKKIFRKAREILNRNENLTYLGRL